MVGKPVRLRVGWMVRLVVAGHWLLAMVLLIGGCNKLMPAHDTAAPGPGREWITPLRPSKEKRAKEASMFFDKRSHDIEDSLGL